MKINKNKIRQHFTVWNSLLYLGVTIAFALAVYALFTQLFFYYDQARDAFEAYDIWHNHNIKILGPGTDIPGVLHGVGWYYLLAVLYGIVRDPLYVTAILLVLTFATVPFVWRLARELFHNKWIPYLAVLLYVFSPIFQLYSRWLSNPWIGFTIMPIFLYALLRFFNTQRTKYIAIVGIGFGLLIQSNFAYLIFLLTVPLYWVTFRTKISLQQVAVFIGGMVITLSSFILAELKFEWRTTKTLIAYLSQAQSESGGIATVAERSGSKIVEMITVSVLPFSFYTVVAISVLAIALLVKMHARTDRKSLLFLGIWLLPLIVFTLFNTGISHSVFVFGPFLVPLVLLVSYLLVTIVRKPSLIIAIVLVLVTSQVYLLHTWYTEQLFPLTVQKGITLQNARKVVDYTYRQADGDQFSITTITVPLYINTTWAFHYEFYGQEKYGDLPFWHGQEQTGQLGSLPYKLFATPLRFMIVEPKEGMPEIFVDKLLYEEEKISDVQDTQNIGLYQVQKRLFNPNKQNVATPSSLLNSDLFE